MRSALKNHYLPLTGRFSCPGHILSTTPALMPADAPTERTMTITQQRSNPPIPARRKPLISSYEPLLSVVTIAFGGYLMALQSAGKNSNTTWAHILQWQKTHTEECKTIRCHKDLLHLHTTFTYNLFLSNNVQNVTFMN